MIIKRRLQQYLKGNRISLEDLHRTAFRDPGELSSWLYAGEGQLFRDISFWKMLTDNPSIAFHEKEPSRLLFFDCPTGEEYYSWVILRNHFKHPAIPSRITTQLKTSASLIARSQLVFKKIGTLPAMLQQLSRDLNIMDYVEEKYGQWFLAIAPPSPPEIEVTDCITPFPSCSFRTVFCRNRLMYYKVDVAALILSNLFRSLLPGGYFLTGINDCRAMTERAGFVPVHPALGIYKKPER